MKMITVCFFALCCAALPLSLSAQSREFSLYEERALQVYLAYYGRPADAEGLAYWSERLEDEGGDLSRIINAFGTSEEYQNRFGNLSSIQLVTNLYRQLFSRTPDPEGLDYYVGLLDSGQRTLQGISLLILDGVQNDDIAIIENRVDFAKEYVALEETGAIEALDAETLAELVATVGADSVVTTAEVQALVVAARGLTVTGLIEGLSGPGSIIVSSRERTRSVAVSQHGDGRYEVLNLEPGDYTIKLVAEGHQSSATQTLRVRGSTPVIRGIDFTAVELPRDHFVFSWLDDDSIAGSEYSAYINTPPAIEILGEVIETIQLAAAQTLRQQYKIVLSDEGEPWSQEHAHRLLDMLKGIPLDESRLVQSKWILSDEKIDQDIQIIRANNVAIVTLSSKAFTYATPLVAEIEGRRGIYFSKDLHHALVYWVTGGGTDIAAVEKILQERFGVSTQVPDYAALTEPTTGETSHSFQPFHAQELITIINQFEEMPSGYHKIDGLDYLVRRLNGLSHPLHPIAPAVAWSLEQSPGYIEFMESAFTGDVCCQYLQRLVIHEKAHFLWANTYSQALQEQWIELGGWFRDSNATSGWSTTKTTEFVSAYAHLENPNEDHSESVAAFIINPDLLRSRSLPKYEFVRDFIMQGTVYLSKIDEDLTFEVYNLSPDYVYPGKIKRIHIEARGAPEEDKQVSVEIELHADNTQLEGAVRAYMRIFSEIDTFVDLYLRPVDGRVQGTVLRGEFTLDKTAKNGYWQPQQITVTDLAGNQRFSGVNDFSWKLYIDNPLEDVIAPSYVPGSLRLSVEANSTDYREPVRLLNSSWQVDENYELNPRRCYATLNNYDREVYSLQQYGVYHPDTGLCNVTFVITRFFAGGRYGVNRVTQTDVAGNKSRQFFSDDPQHEPLVLVDVAPGTNPDDSPPELDINNITISAESTRPERPDGETLVNIVYFARDDKAGLGAVSYTLRDPQGIDHFEYHYHDNYYTAFFEGDPWAWVRYEINVILPVGSAPGTWGLSTMYLSDKAGNFRNFDFTTIVRFEVDR